MDLFFYLLFFLTETIFSVLRLYWCFFFFWENNNNNNNNNFLQDGWMESKQGKSPNNHWGQYIAKTTATARTPSAHVILLHHGCCCGGSFLVSNRTGDASLVVSSFSFSSFERTVGPPSSFTTTSAGFVSWGMMLFSWPWITPSSDHEKRSVEPNGSMPCVSGDNSNVKTTGSFVSGVGVG